MLAEGRIKWAFYPPDFDPNTLVEADKGHGIWIEGEAEDWTAELEDRDDGDSDSDGTSSESEKNVRTISQGEEEGESTEAELLHDISTGAGRFDALNLEDSTGLSDRSSE